MLGTGTEGTPFAATVKGVRQPARGTLTVPEVACAEAIYTESCCVPEAFCIKPNQNSRPRVSNCSACAEATVATSSKRTLSSGRMQG